MTHHHRELVLETMRDALEKANCAPEWFHSDQGSEYTSDDFEELLLLKNINASKSPKASPWRNGAQESFFGRFKVEFGDPACYESLPELMEAIYQYIRYYNYERIHTRLRTTPQKFREKLEKAQSKQNLPHRHQQLPATSSDELYAAIHSRRMWITAPSQWARLRRDPFLAVPLF